MTTSAQVSEAKPIPEESARQQLKGKPHANGTTGATTLSRKSRCYRVATLEAYPAKAAHLIGEVPGADRLLGRTRDELADAMT